MPDDIEANYLDLAVIFEARDANKLGIAESLLQAAEIPYAVRGPKSWGFAGASGYGYIEVKRESAEEARALLAALYDELEEDATER